MNRVLLLVLLLASASAQAGVVVSVSRPASAVGEQVLKEGGNAVDAAVATGLALAVSWPEAGNIGGGGFMLIRPAVGAPVVIDYREKAPGKATVDLFASGKRPAYLTVGVPGSVAGLYLAHQKYGKLPWKHVVAPAVRLAEEGVSVDQGLADSLNAGVKRAKDFPEMLRVFGKMGGWKPGDRLSQPDLARTLSRIRDQGADGFYKGETAELLVKEMTSGSGLITLEDLAGYRAQIREPLRGTYRGYEILVPPLPSGGGTMLLQMLNMLEGHDLNKEGRHSPRTLHLLTEAMRRAYCDRARYLGDTDFVKVPGHLISKEHAKKLAATIDPARATPSETLASEIPLSPDKPETTHYSILDDGGMAVSTTTTLEDSYGARIVVRGAGFLLNNEMTDFNPRPGKTTRTGQVGTEPNLIAPGKRMLSSMTPTIVVRDGKPVLITGSPGGRTIPNTVLCVVLNVLEFGLPLHEAVAAPRLHHQWFPDRLQIEARLLDSQPDTMKALQKLGHQVIRVRAQGDAHSIWLDPKTNTYAGVVDPRRAGRPAAFKEK